MPSIARHKFWFLTICHSSQQSQSILSTTMPSCGWWSRTSTFLFLPLHFIGWGTSSLGCLLSLIARVPSALECFSIAVCLPRFTFKAGRSDSSFDLGQGTMEPRAEAFPWWCNGVRRLHHLAKSPENRKRTWTAGLARAGMRTAFAMPIVHVAFLFSGLCPTVLGKTCKALWCLFHLGFHSCITKLLCIQTRETQPIHTLVLYISGLSSTYLPYVHASLDTNWYTEGLSCSR